MDSVRLTNFDTIRFKKDDNVLRSRPGGLIPSPYSTSTARYYG